MKLVLVDKSSAIRINKGHLEKSPTFSRFSLHERKYPRNISYMPTVEFHVRPDIEKII